MSQTDGSLPVSPARRRRHARLIEALAQLVAECGRGALEVYEPIAAAPPGQGNIPVSLRSITMLAATAAPLLDHAAAEDNARWPDEADREQRASRGTFAARAVTAEAESVLFDTEFPPGDTPGDPSTVSLPTPGQAAALGLVDAGDALVTALDREPDAIPALIRDLTGQHAFTAEEIQTAAVDSLAAAGCLMLREAAALDDPSTAAEVCLSASRLFSRAVTAASMDLDSDNDHTPAGGDQP
ncbi:hypothetical protein [Streptomyces sp. NPDC093223]|uniref:hypothetical protein n=1 Tax=Streptomyces sp. NPDC093223 TaxID=3366033 RepID=UPI0037F10EEC